MECLFTPWRYAYITQQQRASEGCFLCAAAAAEDDPQRLVVHRAARHLVILNRHPYNNGHLMVAPLAHRSSPLLAPDDERDELWRVVGLAQRVLEEAYGPPGLNVGLNLGRAAGAGVPDHFHVHLVPRWEGDTNFMTAVGHTRLIPEDLADTRERLQPIFARLAGVAP